MPDLLLQAHLHVFKACFYAEVIAAVNAVMEFATFANSSQITKHFEDDWPGIMVHAFMYIYTLVDFDRTIFSTRK